MEEYELYDKALAEWLKVTLAGETEPVNLVFATGSRAFQRISYLHNQAKRRKLKLPIMALSRTDSNISPERYKFHPRIPVAWNNEEKTEMKVALCPQPIEIPYQLDIRAVKRKTLDYIKKRIILRFIFDIGYVNVNLGEYGEKYFSVKLEGYSDNSELEVGESEIKMRETLSLSFRGWLFRDTKVVKVIKSVAAKFYDDLKSPEEYLEELNVSI